MDQPKELSKDKEWKLSAPGLKEKKVVREYVSSSKELDS
jgi:hypothetical protein